MQPNTAKKNFKTGRLARQEVKRTTTENAPELRKWKSGMDKGLRSKWIVNNRDHEHRCILKRATDRVQRAA